MELDFDKEMDALLRKARRGTEVISDVPHLDADEIAAFAENALPEKSRGLYMTHLADCDRCRSILSNLFVMQSEAAPLAASSPGVITIAERDLPWYRKLFLFPNLAYVMGSLVLIFGGFLAFTVIQNSRLGSDALVSQAPSESVPENGPSFRSESIETHSGADTANSAANTAQMSANTNATMRAANSDTGASGPRVSDNTFLLDGASTGDLVAAPPPAATAGARPAVPEARERDVLATKEKAEDKDAGTPIQEQAKNDVNLRQQPYSNMPAQSGPSRQNENQYRAQLENSDQRALAKKSAARDDESSGKRIVGGRTFERKQGVWYDTAYQGSPTINVRRGSNEFKGLDEGLRSIANTLSGTLVVVWDAKAYRIQ